MSSPFLILILLIFCYVVKRLGLKVSNFDFIGIFKSWLFVKKRFSSKNVGGWMNVEASTCLLNQNSPHSLIADKTALDDWACLNILPSETVQFAWGRVCVTGSCGDIIWSGRQNWGGSLGGYPPPVQSRGSISSARRHCSLSLSSRRCFSLRWAKLQKQQSMTMRAQISQKPAKHAKNV